MKILTTGLHLRWRQTPCSNYSAPNCFIKLCSSFPSKMTLMNILYIQVDISLKFVHQDPRLQSSVIKFRCLIFSWEEKCRLSYKLNYHAGMQDRTIIEENFLILIKTKYWVSWFTEIRTSEQQEQYHLQLQYAMYNVHARSSSKAHYKVWYGQPLMRGARGAGLVCTLKCVFIDHTPSWPNISSGNNTKSIFSWTIFFY